MFPKVAPSTIPRTAAQRFGANPELPADRSNGRPLRRMLDGVREDCPDGALAYLRGMLTGSSHGLHPLSERALR